MTAFSGAVKVLGHTIEQRDAFHVARIVDAAGLGEYSVAHGVEEDSSACEPVDGDSGLYRAEYHLCRGGEPGDTLG